MATKRLRIRPHRLTDWTELKIGPTARVYVKPVDKATLDAMPTTTRTFLDVGMFDLIGMKLKNIFIPSSRIDRG